MVHMFISRFRLLGDKFRRASGAKKALKVYVEECAASIQLDAFS